MTCSLLKSCDLARFAGQFKNIQARIGAVDNSDEATVIGSQRSLSESRKPGEVSKSLLMAPRLQRQGGLSRGCLSKIDRITNGCCR
jgi:hypothetical protein